MIRRVVCDASALIAFLRESGREGDWVAEALDGAILSAPSLVLIETANVLRRRELARLDTPEEAVRAHASLLALPIRLWPYALLARRVWELRHNLTCYDASYVAVAETLDATLITLDRRLGAARGLRCTVALPG